MIEKHLYDAVVAENEALKREVEELKNRLIVQESFSQTLSSPILPNFDYLYKSESD